MGTYIIGQGAGLVIKEDRKECKAMPVYSKCHACISIALFIYQTHAK